MTDYNSLSWWERFKAFMITGHFHRWDDGHVWTDGDDEGFYYLCRKCGQRNVTEYPC